MAARRVPFEGVAGQPGPGVKAGVGTRVGVPTMMQATGVDMGVAVARWGRAAEAAACEDRLPGRSRATRTRTRVATATAAQRTICMTGLLMHLSESAGVWIPPRPGRSRDGRAWPGGPWAAGNGPTAPGGATLWMVVSRSSVRYSLALL